MRIGAWRRFLIVGVVAGLVAAALGTPALGIAALPLGVAAVTAGFIAARRFKGPVGETWTLFSLGGAGIWIAAVLRAALHAYAPNIASFPSPADAVVAIAYLLLILGTYRMGSIRSGKSRAAYLDGLIVAIAAATVVWSLVLWPYMTDPSHPLTERLVNVAFSVLTTMLLATTMRLAVGPGVRTTSYYLLAAAVGMVFVTDTAATLASVDGRRSGLTLLLGPLIYTFYGAAALHPTMPRMFEPPSDRALLLTRKRLLLLAIGLMIPPLLLVLGDVIQPDFDVAVAAAGSALLAMLVLARFRLLVRAQEEAVEVQRIQREANAHLAAASSRHAMYRAALRAVIDLADGLPDLRVSIAEVTGRSVRILDAVGQNAGPAVGLVIGLDDLPSAVVDGMAQFEVSNAVLDRALDLPPDIGPEGTVHTLVAPLRSQQDLNGALFVTARRPASLSTRQTIEALASTVSLALESAVLTENLMRRRSERRFRALVENSSDIVLVVDPQRTITFASPAAHHLLGLSDKDLIGSHPARWVHPDDWSALARAFAAGDHHPAQADGDEVEIRIRHVNGTHRWFEVRLRDLAHDPEIRGMVVTAREVSDRKATEQQLAASEARFRALVQSSTDIVAVVDAQGYFSYVSPAVTEMLGYEPEELIGTSTLALLAPGEKSNFEVAYPQLMQALAPDENLTVPRAEAQLRHRNGELRSVDMTVTDMRFEPAVGGIVLNARDITVRKALESDLRFQALHDTLTGLPNRTMFTQKTAEALLVTTSTDTIGALFIDLDDFKTVNDSLGHAVGDQLLQEVSRRLIASLSTQDVAARLGGDEFAVLVMDAEDEAGMVALADKVLALVAQPYRIQGRDIRVSASIGIAFGGEEGVNAEVLLRNADVAMYLAKDRGKSGFAVFEAHMHTSVFDRLELKADLVRAIDDGQLRCYYQPIVSLQTGRMTGVEALVRWEHPTRGWLTPDAFIPLAEDTGLIIGLGRWVLREACQQLRIWQLVLPATDTLTMSVNLSVRQLAHEHIVDDVREALEDASLDPSTVTLEITETTLMHDTEVTRECLAELRRIGVSLAVDDFGTGYSSLQYVQRFPIDVIKIDRSFVTGLGTNPGDGAVVQSMIELSQRLGVHTVAEGIDRPEQVRLLRSLGADLGQGYLFSQPLPASGIDALLSRKSSESPHFQIS